MAISTIPHQNSFSSTYGNGNTQTTMNVKTNITSTGASFIITVNRRGNVHSVLQAVVGLSTSYVDLIMTAGTGLTATLANDGFTVSIPAYSRVWVTGSQPFTLS